MADVTVPFGFPYPEPTDLVRQGAADIEALAEGVNDQLNLGLQFVGTRYYTSDGTFVKADPFGDSSFDGAKLRAIRVTAVGAGGGAGGAGTTAAGQNAAGGGGSGGGAGITFISDIAGLDTSVTVTVGSGGAGASAGTGNGSNGGTSSFGSGETYEVIGAGGIGGGGEPGINVPFARGGQRGGQGTGNLVVGGTTSNVRVQVEAAFVFGLLGGFSPLFGTSTVASTTGTGANGETGGRPGEGGRGGVNAASQATARSGGTGGRGEVRIDVFA